MITGLVASQASADPIVRRSLANSIPSQVKTERTTREIPVHTEQSGTGIAVFMGAAGGYLSVIPKATDIEPKKSGPGLLGSATLSFYNPNAVLDLGVGWMSSRVAGSSASSSTTSEVVSATRTGVAEFSPRFRIGKNLQLGPVGSVLFGTQSNFGVSEAGSSTPVFAGARAAIGFETDTLLFRFVAQGSMSLTMPTRQAFLTTAGLEIGIPIIGGKTKIRETEINTVRDNFQRETIETEVIKEVPVIKEVTVVKELMHFTFDDQVVNFEFDKAQIRADSREFLARLGSFLAANASLWGHARIEGHTDSVGTTEYNQKLSEGRARAIADALIAAGVSSDRLDVRGMGKANPIDGREIAVARARNRRVEVSFSEVADGRKLRDEINRIRIATLSPQTCRGGNCR